MKMITYGPDNWVPWDDLKVLLYKAKQLKARIYQPYYKVEFTPEELEERWNRGSYRWGAHNWRLADAPIGEW